jgi:pyruvate carboxylase subunit B
MGALNWAVTLGGQTFELQLSESTSDGTFLLEMGGRDAKSGATPVSLQHVHGDKYLITLGNRTSSVFIDRLNGRYRVVLFGHEFSADVEDARLHRLKEEVGGLHGTAGPLEVLAPMPGLIVSIEVEEGQEVASGQGVVVIESMKMENEIRATLDGRVGRILVEPGMAVDKGQPLVKVLPPE